MKKIRINRNPASKKEKLHKNNGSSTENVMDSYLETVKEIEALITERIEIQQVNGKKTELTPEPLESLYATCPHCGKKLKK
jgi:hypothetical protein